MREVKNTSIADAWEMLFDRHDIINKVEADGQYRITSNEINTVKEARLMAKFDQSTQLPKIFKENGLSILPVTRGEYLIGAFKTHESVIYSDVKPKQVEIPDLQTIDHKNLYSESSALLFAYNSGIIQDIMGSSKINFTVNGRMSSGSFEYEISNILVPAGKQKIYVQNAQVEIDAGYESPDAFCLCEAKNVSVEELLIRQLYYPYRLWCSKISKPVIPLFMVYSNDIFHTFIYRFEDNSYYNSIKLIDHQAYTFADEDIRLDDIIELWKSIKPIEEPKVTFPQADSFARVVDLLSVLFERNLTRDEITFQYEFNERQTNYYISACEYLGLIIRTQNDEGERVYQLTIEAKYIMSLGYKQKYLGLIKKVLERSIFNKAFGLAISSSASPSKDAICKIMIDSSLSINTTTIERRSSTVKGWIDWIFDQSISE